MFVKAENKSSESVTFRVKAPLECADSETERERESWGGGGLICVPRSRIINGINGAPVGVGRKSGGADGSLRLAIKGKVQHSKCCLSYAGEPRDTYSNFSSSNKEPHSDSSFELLLEKQLNRCDIRL